jgi:cold shock CspA family protein
MIGIVKNIVVKKAFGFIKAINKEQEYFFHRDDFNGHWYDLVNDWNNDEEVFVEFEVVPAPKGPRASKVRRTDFPNQAV